MRCQVTDCKKVATKTWALVHVCSDHRKEIRTEFLRYYAQRITASERVTYETIRHLTPWEKKRH